MSFLHISTEGDLITIIDSSDLNLAKQLSRLLKITIFGEFTKNASENLSYFLNIPSSSWQRTFTNLGFQRGTGSEKGAMCHPRQSQCAHRRYRQGSKDLISKHSSWEGRGERISKCHSTEPTTASNHSQRRR